MIGGRDCPGPPTLKGWRRMTDSQTLVRVCAWCAHTIGEDDARGDPMPTREQVKRVEEGAILTHGFCCECFAAACASLDGRDDGEQT